MRLSIPPIMGTVTYRSRSALNAELLQKYASHMDTVDAERSNAAAMAPPAGDQLARPLTRALPNLKSAGVFSYLRGSRKSGGTGSARSQSANVRDSARPAAEVPIMPPMARDNGELTAIHQDTPHDNAVQVAAVHRTRHPGAHEGAAEKQITRLAPVPTAAGGEHENNRKIAIRQRNSFMLNLINGTDGIYSRHGGLYAA